MLRMETKACPERMGFDTRDEGFSVGPLETPQRIGRRLPLIGPNGEAGARVEVHDAGGDRSTLLRRRADPQVAPLEPEHLSTDSSDLDGLEVAVVVGGDDVDDRASSRCRDDRSLSRQHLADGGDGSELERLHQSFGDRSGLGRSGGIELASWEMVEPVHVAVALRRDEQRR